MDKKAIDQQIKAADYRKRHFYWAAHIVGIAFTGFLFYIGVPWPWALGIGLFVWLHQIGRVRETPINL